MSADRRVAAPVRPWTAVTLPGSRPPLQGGRKQWGFPQAVERRPRARFPSFEGGGCLLQRVGHDRRVVGRLRSGVVGHRADWCSKCGGYAVRRLTDTQLSYYRAAHRLHDIAEQLDDERTHRVPVDPDALIKQLEGLAGWEPGGHVDCGWDGSWRWHEVIRNLRRRAERKRGSTAS